MTVMSVESNEYDISAVLDVFKQNRDDELDVSYLLAHARRNQPGLDIDRLLGALEVLVEEGVASKVAPKKWRFVRPAPSEAVLRSALPLLEDSNEIMPRIAASAAKKLRGLHARVFDVLQERGANGATGRDVANAIPGKTYNHIAGVLATLHRRGAITRSPKGGSREFLYAIPAPETERPRQAAAASESNASQNGKASVPAAVDSASQPAGGSLPASLHAEIKLITAVSAAISEATVANLSPSAIARAINYAADRLNEA